MRNDYWALVKCAEGRELCNCKKAYALPDGGCEGGCMVNECLAAERIIDFVKRNPGIDLNPTLREKRLLRVKNGRFAQALSERNRKAWDSWDLKLLELNKQTN